MPKLSYRLFGAKDLSRYLPQCLSRRRLFGLAVTLFLLHYSFSFAAAQIQIESLVPRLVRIETIGGLEKAGGELANTGTTSGVLLDNEGYIITSAFNFLHNPSSIILILPDGTRRAAKLIAADKLRHLTLLKTDTVKTASVLPLPSLPVRSKDSLIIGERCLAVGVTLSPTQPNVAAGIISGTDRIWGKAVQTDAAVGPNNYGGVLADGKGNVIGILVPLSMMSDELIAGAEFYDAGVGMAVPMEDITALLPKLKAGKDLLPGHTGIRYKDNQTFVGNTVIFQVEPHSPAALAGITSGDRILSIDGKVMRSALDVTKNLKLRYAGETLQIEYQRNAGTQTVNVTASSE
ncbi:MAG: S1C family serine protease [Planctomycetaceae bacterium]|jgi:serine protease Do|nr:S1C family serine protease [Planctomycetaceae bacterium]